LTFSACRMHQKTDLHVKVKKSFVWRQCSQTPCGEVHPSPDLMTLCAPAHRASRASLRAFGPSIGPPLSLSPQYLSQVYAMLLQRRCHRKLPKGPDSDTHGGRSRDHAGVDCLRGPRASQRLKSLCEITASKHAPRPSS